MMAAPTPDRSLQFHIRRQSDITLAVMACLRPSFLPDIDRDERAVIGTIVSELGTNILKYAVQGHIRLQPLVQDGRHGVRVEAIDQGPGIADLDSALKDGYSTGGTLGLGLPAVRRLTDALNITSPEGGGTRVEAIRWCRRPARASAGLALADRALRTHAPAPEPAPSTTLPGKPLRVRIETRQRPFHGKTVCGDRTWCREAENHVLIVHLDGTGHGSKADHAVARIIGCIEEQTARWPAQPKADLLPELLDACHRAAVGTVGASMTVALIDRTSHTLHQVGVGNTSIMQFSPHGWEGVARPGVVGQRYGRPLVSSHRLQPGDVVITFSDGLSRSAIRRWRKHGDRPMLASAVADFLMTQAKDSDDASCLVVEVLA
jgi:anti-sigma regulatory factor (Ser/Thr protein kinase)